MSYSSISCLKCKHKFEISHRQRYRVLSLVSKGGPTCPGCGNPVTVETLKISQAPKKSEDGKRSGGDLSKEVMVMLLSSFDHPATVQEISDRSGFWHNTIRRRLKTFQEQGFVVYGTVEEKSGWMTPACRDRWLDEIKKGK